MGVRFNVRERADRNTVSYPGRRYKLVAIDTVAARPEGIAMGLLGTSTVAHRETVLCEFETPFSDEATAVRDIEVDFTKYPDGSTLTIRADLRPTKVANNPLDFLPPEVAEEAIALTHAVQDKDLLTVTGYKLLDLATTAGDMRETLTDRFVASTRSGAPHVQGPEDALPEEVSIAVAPMTPEEGEAAVTGKKRGRPALSEEEKAARQAEKDAKKAARHAAKAAAAALAAQTPDAEPYAEEASAPVAAEPEKATISGMMGGRETFEDDDGVVRWADTGETAVPGDEEAVAEGNDVIDALRGGDAAKAPNAAHPF